MPAERSRQPKRDASEGALLTWTVLAEPSSPAQGIAFAPNVTPVTFNDPPTTLETSFEPILFPSTSSESASRKPAHSRKRSQDHIPRPPNAFILFRSSFIKSQHVSTEVETNHSTLSKIIGLTWQNMPHDERQIWHAKAKKALEEHRKKWPQYAFRPSHAKAKAVAEKRRVREVEPKDLKRCAKIAELLVEGKKGAELDAAIQEFDRTHVPEIVTRFDTPITARAYRRSSSVPIDDAAPKKPFLSLSPPTTPRRVRSTSSQPFLKSSQTPKQQPQAPQALVYSQSCPDLSGSSYPTSPEYSFPPKPQPSFELDPFMFDVAFGNSIPSTSADLTSYPSTPSTRAQAPALCFDPAYGNDWTPASSPFSSSPTTPQALSPQRAFDCPTVDSEDPFSLGFALDPFAPSHHQYTAGLDVFDNDNAINGACDFAQPPDFTVFSKTPFSFGDDGSSGRKPELASVDMEFSTFMSSLSAF
ncbi:hypothetical protein F5I97DRAFT_1121382 [Phlebopus sp. FC_14]|nr:hypothetical protein F5I97DRAFT_1121382 [Phlebopus sp. FC_14]